MTDQEKLLKTLVTHQLVQTNYGKPSPQSPVSQQKIIENTALQTLLKKGT